MTMDERTMPANADTTTVDPIQAPPEVIYQLQPNIKLHLLYSRCDGEPYIRITRTLPSTSDEMHINYKNFVLLTKKAAVIDRCIHYPTLNCCRYFYLENGVGVKVTTKSADPEYDDDVMLDIHRYYDGSSLLHSIKIDRGAWKVWQNNFDDIKKWMQHIQALKQRQKLRHGVRLNFKTLVQAQHFPAGLTFIRQQEYKDTRTFTLPKDAAEALKTRQWQIKSNIATQQEMNVKLTGPYHVGTTIFKDKMYVSFGLYDGEGNRQKGVGMNIDVPAFKALTKHLDQLLESMDYTIFYKAKTIIKQPAEQAKELEQQYDEAERLEEDSDCLIVDEEEPDTISVEDDDETEDEGGSVSSTQSSPLLLSKNAKTPLGKRKAELPPTPSAPKKPKVAEAKRPMVKTYVWRWTSKRGRCIRKSPFYYFKEAACRNDAENNKPDAENLELVIEAGSDDKPAAKSLMQKLARKYVTMQINEKKITKCAGCKHNSKSQIPHMEGGCMQDWDRAVETYLPDCLDAVNTKYFRCWLRNVLEAMDYPVASAEDLILDWCTELDGAILKEKLINDNLTEYYQSLFDNAEPKE